MIGRFEIDEGQANKGQEDGNSIAVGEINDLALSRGKMAVGFVQLDSCRLLPHKRCPGDSGMAFCSDAKTALFLRDSPPNVGRHESSGEPSLERGHLAVAAGLSASPAHCYSSQAPCPLAVSKYSKDSVHQGHSLQHPRQARSSS
jgi:hypothetical protein